VSEERDFPKSPLSEGAQKFRAAVNQRFAQYLKKVRTRAGYTQLDLSLSLGRGPKYIWRLENCYSEPDIFEFIEIMEVLGVDPAAALGYIAQSLQS
jgi:transcriptional regulator with XRE-family HTH domain